MKVADAKRLKLIKKAGPVIGERRERKWTL